MTSGTILPSIGPPPPEFRRAFVPENLRPKLASETEKQSPRQTPSAQPQAKISNRPSETQPADTLLQLAGQQDQRTAARAGQSTAVQPQASTSAPPPSANLGGASAVAVQVQESEPAALDVSAQAADSGLSDEEKAIVQELLERDREVRAHENAHANIGGAYAGRPSYEFARGPDGAQYAVGGQVDIDVGPIPNDPEATIAKMDVVRSAALAPARPSGQDRAVAATAAANIREAEAQLSRQEKEEIQAENEKKDALGAAAEPGNGASEGAFVLQGAAATGDVLTGLSDPGLGAQPTISLNLLV